MVLGGVGVICVVFLWLVMIGRGRGGGSCCCLAGPSEERGVLSSSGISEKGSVSVLK